MGRKIKWLFLYWDCCFLLINKKCHYWNFRGGGLATSWLRFAFKLVVLVFWVFYHLDLAFLYFCSIWEAIFVVDSICRRGDKKEKSFFLLIFQKQIETWSFDDRCLKWWIQNMIGCVSALFPYSVTRCFRMIIIEINFKNCHKRYRFCCKFQKWCKWFLERESSGILFIFSYLRMKGWIIELYEKIRLKIARLHSGK